MNNQRDLVGIGEAAEAFGVTPSTLRRWEREGRITPARTLGGQRRYDVTQIKQAQARALETTQENENDRHT